MAFGMEIFDASGVLQANCELLSYFCRRSGTGTTVSAAGIGNTVPSKGVIPVAGAGYSYPLIAVRCPGYTVARVSNGSGSDMTFACSAPVGTSFTYYIFDYSPAIPASSFGIELYNSAGQRTFSSNYFPLQALSVVRSVGGSVTYAGKSLAIGLCETGGYRQFPGYDYYSGGFPIVSGGFGDYDSTGYRNDAKLYGAAITNSNQTLNYGTVSFDDVYIGPTPGDAYVPPDWSYVCPVLAVDVTNIPVPANFF